MDLPQIVINVFDLHCLSPPKAHVAQADARATGTFGSGRVHSITFSTLFRKKDYVNNWLKMLPLFAGSRLLKTVLCFAFNKLSESAVYVIKGVVVIFRFDSFYVFYRQHVWPYQHGTQTSF